MENDGDDDAQENDGALENGDAHENGDGLKNDVGQQELDGEPPDAGAEDAHDEV